MGENSGSFKPTWTNERVEILTKLWASGKSASEIGREMGTTRNAVISKVHREGLPIRSKDVALHNVRRLTPRAPKQLRAPRTPRPPRPPKERAQNNFAAANAERRSQAPLGPDMESVQKLHEVPATARPWLTRGFSECAFPVAGLGAETVSCCAGTGGETYCRAHRKVMFAKPLTPAQRAHMAKMRAARRAA